MKSQKIIIGFLVGSALVLSLLLVVMPSNPQTANAAMMAAGRDYMLLASDDANGTAGPELISVMDTRTLKVVVYDIHTDRLIPVAAQNVSRFFVAPR